MRNTSKLSVIAGLGLAMGLASCATVPYQRRDLDATQIKDNYLYVQDSDGIDSVTAYKNGEQIFYEKFSDNKKKQELPLSSELEECARLNKPVRVKVVDNKGNIFEKTIPSPQEEEDNSPLWGMGLR